MTKILYSIMSLTPEVLLSSASKERCIVKLKELPSFISSASEAKHQASVLVPLCINNGKLCLLYTLRAAMLSTHSGQVSFPGGKMDEGETVYETALRETEEEIGFPRNDVDLWTKMPQVQGRNKNILITPVVGYLKSFDLNNLLVNENEVEEVFTVPMQAFCDTTKHACLHIGDIPTPVYLCGKHRIWGITGVITHFFLQSFLPNNVYDFDFSGKKFELDELMPSKL